APLHRRPRTDRHLLSAAPQALPLTEMVFRSFVCAPTPEKRPVPVSPLTAFRSSERALSCEKRFAPELCLDCDAAWREGSRFVAVNSRSMLEGWGFLRGLTFDMRGGRQPAKPDVAR